MKLLLAALFISLGLGVFAQPVLAQRATPVPILQLNSDATSSATATDSSLIATDSSELASPAATLTPRTPEKNQDITEPTGTTKDKLVLWLEQNPIGDLSPLNPLQYVLRRAISNGLSVNIVVLILLFPIITSIIAFTRHIIGLKGFGIYIPAVLSVAFVSTGIINGIVLFLIILGAAMLTRKVVRRLKMQALPRTAMLLWGVSLVVLLVLVALAFLPANTLLTINIFPLLIIMLLTENFMESQLITSQSEATQLTLETLVTAIVCSVIVGNESVQQQVILHPELMLITVAAVNIIVSRYTGLRLLEWIRFRSVIE